MTLNELEWLANTLVSKQIDSAAYVHTLSALFVEVPNIADRSTIFGSTINSIFFKYCNWIMDVGSTELKILQLTQPYVDQGYSQLHLLVGRV